MAQVKKKAARDFRLERLEMVSLGSLVEQKYAGHATLGIAGRADSAGDGEAVEVGAFFGEAVDVGCLDVRVAVAGEVAPAPIIGEDKKNIGLFCSV